ncbi:C45 family autoproteolytic acyltransferase/hydrolase [candidate division KSB1 bacterium]
MKKVVRFFSLLFFFSAFLIPGLLTAQTPDQQGLPPDILPVVIVSGSDYEMGFQYGQQAGLLIEKRKDEAWADGLRRYTREEINKTLQANQYYIRKHTPEHIEVMKGIADGCKASGYNVNYRDVVLMNCTIPKPETSTFPEGAENDELPTKKCSVCSAWGSTTKEGKLIGMDTLDGGEAYFGVVIVAFPDKGNNYMTGSLAGSIGSHFLMNNKGLFIGNSGGGGSPRDIDSNYGISWFSGLPYIARFANNATEARDMMVKWQIDIAENFHFVDVDGNAYVVEKTSAIQDVRKPGDFGEKDFLYSTNNYLSKKMKVTKRGDFVKKHGGYGAYAAPRNIMLWDMLNNYHGQVDVEFVKMMLRFPGNPPPYPPDGGWDAKVCRPSNSWVSVLLPDNGDRGEAYICTGPAGRVIQSSMGPGGRKMRTNYQYINGTHTFYKLILGKDPLEVVRRAKSSARSDIATAYEKFMQLNLTDPGYDVLSELYSLANKEYYMGNNALNKAGAAAGNEINFYLAKAATAYARAQAHSLQVYEALVPPPTSPTDLGLKPFGGDWAEWETRVGKAK